MSVYHSVDLERMRCGTLVGFSVWAGEAAALIEEANLTKRDYKADAAGDLPDLFRDTFGDDE